MKYINSKVEKIKLDDFEIFVKRDDLLDRDFSGNKARKFYYYLLNDFENINKIIGHGSVQANSLYSLSVLAKLKGWKFDFYVDHIPSFVKEHPSGNYKASLLNDANIIDMSQEDTSKCASEYIQEDIIPTQNTSLFIPEGGRCKEAEFGVQLLAQELKEWILKEKIINPKIILPSGTGTTALFLQKNLPDIEVLTCACVGGEEYLKKQFLELESNEEFHPIIFQTEKKYHFGKLYKSFYEVYEDVYKQTKIEFDLLYDPLGLMCLKQYLKKNSIGKPANIIYIHQGGLLGNETMKERYLRKYNF